MTDPSSEPGQDNALARILRSDLPDEVKERLVRRLIAERQSADQYIGELTDRLLAELAEGRVAQSADELIAEVEAHLREGADRNDPGGND